MTAFDVRLADSAQHEMLVYRALVNRGWTVGRWDGVQTCLDALHRDVYCDLPPIIRCRPDIIAVRGREWFMVDPKGRWHEITSSYAVNTEALEAHKQTMYGHFGRLIYVFRSMQTLSLADFEADGFPWAASPNAGSGTAFTTVWDSACRSLDEVFGEVR